MSQPKEACSHIKACLPRIACHWRADACAWFYNMRKCNKTILDMFGELGCHNVVMLFLERSEHHLTYLVLLLRSFAQLYCALPMDQVAHHRYTGVLAPKETQTVALLVLHSRTQHPHAKALYRNMTLSATWVVFL